MLDDAIILAVASPPGQGARGIVRLSGVGSFGLLALLAADEIPARRGVYRTRLRLPGGAPALLPCLALCFPAPASYTGEDIVELLLPGNPALLERVIDAFLAASRMHPGLDVRRAGPGEYSARAFLNGRLSLAQAEGVAAAIAARSDAELQAAALLARGEAGEFARQIADQLAEALALVEAGIDFTDQEDVVIIAPADLLVRLTDVARTLRARLDRAVGVESLQAIPWVVLAGAPNAGKSTLFNALLGRNRAVVSAVAGTTRDVLTEPLVVSHPPSAVSHQFSALRGQPTDMIPPPITDHPLSPAASVPGSPSAAEVMLVDAAGLDDAGVNFLDDAMRQAASDALRRAELILLCVPYGDSLPESIARSRIDPADPRVLVVRTKADVASQESPDSRHQPSAGSRHLHPGHRDAMTDGQQPVTVCALTGLGLDDLRAAIAGCLAGRAVALAADALALQPRHESGLRAALASVEEAAAMVEAQAPRRVLVAPELIAAGLRSALDELAEVAGDVTPDDVLGRIFGRFCIGK